MADCTLVTPVVSGQPPGKDEQEGAEGDRGSEGDKGGGLTDSQTALLEKCLHSLTHAKNDSHTLAALLLVSVSGQKYIQKYIVCLAAWLMHI